MIGRAILLGTFALLGIASLRTEPLQISEAQQVTSTPTRTPTATGSSTPSVTITPSASQTPTVTVTVAPAPTSTSLPTLNRIPPSGTLTVIRLPTLVPTATRTPTRTPTPSPTRSVTPTASRTPTVTITGTATTTVAPTSTPTSLPAVIVDLATTSLTRSSATVTWSTNAPATSQVEYTNAAGTTIRSTVDPSLVSAHRVVLVGLQPGTTYRFGARSFTADGVETVSQDATFTTAATGSGPEVANPHVSQATGTTATVEWATSTGTVAQVEYGRGANYGSFTLLKIFATPTQSMTLVDLKPATVYHFPVKAWDGQGQLAASSDGIFSTAPSGQATLIGDDTMQTDYLTLPGGQAAAFQYVAAQSGQASVLHLFVESGTTAPMVRAALYTDQDGTPGTILTQGSAPALVTGWINVSIPPVSLLQGTRYWLIVLSPLGAGSLNVRQAALGGSSLASAQASLAAFPQPFVAGAPGARSPLSAYVQQVPPAITLTGPPDGSVVSGPVQLSAVVDDDVALSRVQFFVDGVPVGAPLSKAPYTVAWDSAGLNTDLPHTISARASDVAGRSSASGMVSVQVDNGPRIADVSFGPGLTASSARVTWTTDVPSDAQVEYGPTTTYGLVTPVDSRLDARHDMQLTSLAADGVYHYRVRSRDANGALAVSPDAVFYTAPSP